MKSLFDWTAGGLITAVVCTLVMSVSTEVT